MEKKKILSSLIVFIFIFCGALPFSPKIVNASEIIEVWDWYDLNAVRVNLSGNYLLMKDLDSTTSGYTDLASETANDGMGWQPIGNSTNRFTGSFDGHGYEISDLHINRPETDRVGLFGFLGSGGLITDVFLVNAHVTGNRWVGALVGVNTGTICNSNVTGDVSGASSVGGLSGTNESQGMVRNSYATGKVEGIDYVGGLVGWNGDRAVISNSHSSGNVTGERAVGGLIGENYESTVRDSYFLGKVTGNKHVGGLVGFNSGNIVSNSFYNYNEALINGENIITIGALFGEEFNQWLANDRFLDIDQKLSQENGYYLINDIDDFKKLLSFGQDDSLRFRLKNDLDFASEPNFIIPYLAGELHGNGHVLSNLNFNFDFVSTVGLIGYLATGGKVMQVGVENLSIVGHWCVGGLVGYNYQGAIYNSYSSGSLVGESYIGGLVGGNYKGIVGNSYSSSKVSGEWFIGGLVGWNYEGTLNNSYSRGKVTGDDYVGGLVGENNQGSVRNSFWDMETSNTEISDGGTGKTTSEMQDIVTFTDTATEGLGSPWDIAAVVSGETNNEYTWNIINGEDYPFLSGKDWGWAQRYSGTNHRLYDVVWCGSQFVVVGEGGTILTSPDGEEWTQRDSGTEGWLRSVTWDGSKYVAVSGNTILTSPDGIAWKALTLEKTLLAPYSIAWSGDQFVAVGRWWSLLWSSDGVDWDHFSSTHQAPWLMDITWGNNQFVAVGVKGLNDPSDPTYGYIMTSPDGRWGNWTERHSGVGGESSYINGVTWSGSQFLAVGASGLVLTSPDGVTWTRRTWRQFPSLLDVTWGCNQFVAVGWNGVILNSQDGVQWAENFLWPGIYLDGVTWGNNRFVAVGQNGIILTSKPALQYKIKTTANPEQGGSVTGTGTYDYGDQVTVEATSNSGWTFVNWTENGQVASTDNPYTFTARTDRNLVANFAQTGSLQIFIDPQEAADAGARWRIKGTDIWFYSGETAYNVPAGTHTIEFQGVPGWRPEGTITVNVEANTTATGTGSYFEQTTVLPGVLMLLLDDE